MTTTEEKLRYALGEINKILSKIMAISNILWVS